MRKFWGSTALVGAAALVFAAVGPAVPATAAKASPTSWETFFTSTYGDDDCTAGATCTGSQESTADGGQSVSSSLSRPTPAAVGGERHYGGAVGGTTYKVPRGTASVTATFSWVVESGSASVTMLTPESVGFARAHVLGQASGCATCEITVASGTEGVQVVEAGGAAAPHAAFAVEGQTLTDTVTITGPDGGPIPNGTWLFLRGYTVSFSYLGPVSEDLSVVGLAGEVDVSAVTDLVSISVARTAA